MIVGLIIYYFYRRRENLPLTNTTKSREEFNQRRVLQFFRQRIIINPKVKI